MINKENIQSIYEQLEKLAWHDGKQVVIKMDHVRRILDHAVFNQPDKNSEEVK